MISLLRTNSENIDFQSLVKDLDLDLKIRDGEEHAFFAQFNKIDMIKYVVVVYDNNKAIGCGAVKHYSDKVMEVKRMYTIPEARGKGIASMVLNELENWSRELAYEKCILETGINQPEAIQLYKKNNFCQIPNYGQYENVKSSVCFEKSLAH